MNLEVFTEYVNVVILGICLCVGYVLKNVITTDKINRFIPLIAGCLGIILSAWMNNGFTPAIILTGLVSGLASTGMYEAFKNLINKTE